MGRRKTIFDQMNHTDRMRITTRKDELDQQLTSVEEFIDKHPRYNDDEQATTPNRNKDTKASSGLNPHKLEQSQFPSFMDG